MAVLTGGSGDRAGPGFGAVFFALLACAEIFRLHGATLRQTATEPRRIA